MGRVRAWVQDRFGLGPISETLLERRVAKAPWYFGDGATLMLLLGVLVVTGMMMTLTYSPTPGTAFESVKYISERQTLGWFIRGLHYWSAGLMVVMVFWHLFREILVGGYKSPREGTWLVGVGLLVLVLIMGWSGYILRWDQRAVSGLKVGLHILNRVPLIGEHLVVFVQGGREISALTATRLYALHVVIVPLLLLALVGFHLYLVVLHGVTSPVERQRPVKTAEEQKKLYKEQSESKEHGETFYPDTMFRSGRIAMLVFGIVLLLALFAGAPGMMDPADLVSPAEPAEEWWYWWISGLIALLPSWAAPWFVVIFPLVALIVLLALPFVDRSPWRGIRNRPITTAVVAAIVLGMLYLTDLRRASPWTGWPAGPVLEVPEGIVIPPRAELGRQLFATYGCSSCHPIAGQGPQIGPDLARLPVPYSRVGMREYILRPPAGVVMPAYEGRITEHDLERILDFVHSAQTFPRR